VVSAGWLEPSAMMMLDSEVLPHSCLLRLNGRTGHITAASSTPSADAAAMMEVLKDSNG
jgi:hypothetical protein